MVHVAFKTVYLFLAFFALPQVLAAPGAANLDRRAPFPLPQEVQDEALKLLNALRAPKAPRLTWSINLSALSAIYASSCGTDRVTSFGTSSDGLSLFAEDTHVRVYRDPGSYRLLTRGDQTVGFGQGTA